MDNIKYSYQMNMWGMPKFKKIKEFEEWYNRDFTADGYYQDWDMILKYLSTAGFKGIELMWMQIDFIRMLFGSLPAFTEFLNERGIEYRLLEGTRDIWVRDFMPVKTGDGRHVSFRSCRRDV